MKNNNYSRLASDSSIKLAKHALESHSITVYVAKNANETRKKIREFLPVGIEVMTATSTSLDQLGVTEEINESGKYDAVKAKLMKMDRNTQGIEMQKLGAAPEYVIGSVHAVTEDGTVVVASGSGSQLAAYTYGAAHVVWVVSTKKIVKNLEEALDRVYKHVLPQEDARMKKVYGPAVGSNVNKLFILNKELNPTRINLIFVKEDLGF